MNDLNVLQCIKVIFTVLPYKSTSSEPVGKLQIV